MLSDELAVIHGLLLHVRNSIRLGGSLLGMVTRKTAVVEML